MGLTWIFKVICDLDHLVIKVRCRDLPDSDRGDFSCRRAVDSSSSLCVRNCTLIGSKPMCYQSTTRTNDNLSIRALGTNLLCEIGIEIVWMKCIWKCCMLNSSHFVQTVVCFYLSHCMGFYISICPPVYSCHAIWTLSSQPNPRADYCRPGPETQVSRPQWPLLLTWFNFNPSMDKLPCAQWSVGWNLFIHSEISTWNLGMDE